MEENIDLQPLQSCLEEITIGYNTKLGVDKLCKLRRLNYCIEFEEQICETLNNLNKKFETGLLKKVELNLHYKLGELFWEHRKEINRVYDASSLPKKIFIHIKELDATEKFMHEILEMKFENLSFKQNQFCLRSKSHFKLVQMLSAITQEMSIEI